MKRHQLIDQIESCHDWHLVFSVGRVFVEQANGWFVSGGRPGQCASFDVELERGPAVIHYHFRPLAEADGFKGVCRLLKHVDYSFGKLVALLEAAQTESGAFELKGFLVSVERQEVTYPVAGPTAKERCL